MADQINQGGAQNQEQQDPKQTGLLQKERQREKQDDRAFPDREPALKKTGEF